MVLFVSCKSTRGVCTLVDARRVPLAVRIFFTRKNALCFSSNELLKIEYLRAVLIDTSADEHRRTNVEILFRI